MIAPPSVRWPTEVDWLTLIGEPVDLEFWYRGEEDVLIARVAGFLESVAWVVDETRAGEVVRPAIWRFRGAAAPHVVIAEEDRPRAMVAFRVGVAP